MRARIFQRPKTATQSGRAGSDDWVLDYGSNQREKNDPLMGWWGGTNTQNQVRLAFDSKEAAVAYARGNGLELFGQEHALKVFVRGLNDGTITRAPDGSLAIAAREAL